MSYEPTRSTHSCRARTRIVAASIAIIVAVASSACSSSTPSGGATSASSASGETVTLITHSSFAATDAVIAEFTTTTGIKVEIPKSSSDAGEVLARAILAKGKPEGDVLWGVDNTLLSKAITASVFVPYTTTALATLDTGAAALVPGHELTPVDLGDVCVNYDRAAFDTAGKPPAPKTLDDLIKPEYRGQLEVENPQTSSPGLVFFLATVARYGKDGWKDYWTKLKANGVSVVDDWTKAYTVDFSGSAGKGSKPMVVSYASSPVAEVLDVTPPPATSPTAAMTDGCFRQVEFAGILKGTKHRKAAEQLIDFLLSKTFQEDMPLNMFVSPVISGATVPDIYKTFTVTPPVPLSLAPTVIAANRDKWVEEWTTLVLR